MHKSCRDMVITARKILSERLDRQQHLEEVVYTVTGLHSNCRSICCRHLISYDDLCYQFFCKFVVKQCNGYIVTYCRINKLNSLGVKSVIQLIFNFLGDQFLLFSMTIPATEIFGYTWMRDEVWKIKVIILKQQNFSPSAFFFLLFLICL